MAMLVNNTKFDTLNLLSILKQNTTNSRREVQKTTTTSLNINDAIDNVSAYAIEESLRIRTRILSRVTQNIQDDTALLKTAQGSSDSIVDSIKEIQKLAISATDESITDDDRRVIQRDINRLVNQISENAQVSFNGRNLIDGSATTGNQAIATVLSNNSLYSGTTADTALTALQSSNGASLGIDATDRITASYVKDGNIYTTSFSVDNNTLEDIFRNLNKINGVTEAEDGRKTLTDAAFVGGGGGIVTAPAPIRDEPMIPEEKVDPTEPNFDRPERVFSQAPSVIAEPETLLIPAESIPTEPNGEEVSSAYEELGTTVRALGDSLRENLPESIGNTDLQDETPLQDDEPANLPEEDLPAAEGNQSLPDAEQPVLNVDEFISNLQSEMLQRQSDGSIMKLSDLTATNSYQRLSDEEKGLLSDDVIATINTALNDSDYADKVDAHNAANAEYNTARAQYQAYDKAIQAGAQIIYKPELGEEATPEDQAQYDINLATYNNAVDNYSAQTAIDYIAARKLYEDNQRDWDEYNKFTAWQDYDRKRDEYLTYINETLPAYKEDKAKYDLELAKFNEDMAEYRLMAAPALQNDSNGLSVTARLPGHEGQISGISINVTDSAGNAKSVANAALNKFKTTTFAADEREDNSISFQIGETAGQTMNFGFDDMRSEAFGLKGANGKIISISTKADADAALSTIENALNKATEQIQMIGSSEKRLGYIADSLSIEINNIQEPDSLIRNANMAKTFTLYALDIFNRDRTQSMFAIANQHSSSVLALLR